MIRSFGIGTSTVDNGEGHTQLIPRMHRGDGTVAPCVLGFGHNAEPNPALLLMFDLFFAGDIGWATARGGYPTYAGDLQNNSWGNDGAILSLRQGLDWFRETYGLDARDVYLVGGSMGFLACSNFAHWVNGGFEIDFGGIVPPPDVEVKALAGIIPAVNLDAIHDANRSGYAAEIEGAYGGLAAYDAALPTHDPALYAASFAAHNVPTALWYSTNDTSVLPSEVLAYASAAGAETHSMGTIGHSYLGLDLTEIVDFFDAQP